MYDNHHHQQQMTRAEMSGGNNNPSFAIADRLALMVNCVGPSSDGLDGTGDRRVLLQVCARLVVVFLIRFQKGTKMPDLPIAMNGSIDRRSEIP
jgi:hypothetical protein